MARSQRAGWSSRREPGRSGHLLEVTEGPASSAYMLTNLNSSQVLQVADGSTAAGANVVQGTYSGENDQLWEITVP